MPKKYLVALSALLIVLVGAVPAQATQPNNDEPDVTKVFVCKYVGTPGDDERLQTGNNPVSEATSSIAGFTAVYPEEVAGYEFNKKDDQGRSIVIGWDDTKGGGQGGEPGIEDCPAPDKPQPVTEWHTWEVPVDCNAIVDGKGKDEGYGWQSCSTDPAPWPQTYVGPGKEFVPPCGVWYQVDQYTGTPKQIADVLDENTLTQGEDYSIVKDWFYVYGGDCEPPVDVCPNIEGAQGDIPDGMIVDNAGDCVVPPEVKVDICHRDEGHPEWKIISVTEGALDAHLNHGDVYPTEGACPPPPVDLCPNIDGVQTEVPDGMVINDDDMCVQPPKDEEQVYLCIDWEKAGPFPADSDQAKEYALYDEATCVEPKVDICHRDEGKPEWTIISVTEGSIGAHINHGDVYPVDGGCPPVLPPPPVDACPNIDGDQATVPDGMVYDEQDNCVVPPSVDGVTATPMCMANYPYVSYEVTFGDSDIAATAGGVTFTFQNPSGPDAVVTVPDFVGKFLWPGADPSTTSFPGLSYDSSTDEFTNVGNDNFGWTLAPGGVTVAIGVEVTADYATSWGDSVKLKYPKDCLPEEAEGTESAPPATPVSAEAQYTG